MEVWGKRMQDDDPESHTMEKEWDAKQRNWHGKAKRKKTKQGTVAPTPAQSPAVDGTRVPEAEEKEEAPPQVCSLKARRAAVKKAIAEGRDPGLIGFCGRVHTMAPTKAPKRKEENEGKAALADPEKGQSMGNAAGTTTTALLSSPTEADKDTQPPSTMVDRWRKFWFLLNPWLGIMLAHLFVCMLIMWSLYTVHKGHQRALADGTVE